MSKPLRIVFAGTPDFAAHHLQALLDQGKHQIIAVYSQPDRPAGRGKKCKPSPVKQLALDYTIPVYQPLSLKDAEAQQTLAALAADIMVVVAYGLLLPQTVLDTPALGCINVHASLLPRWRGAAPIQRAIEAGDSETGVTIMQMDRGLDTGAMLQKAVCSIEPRETGGSLHDKLLSVGCPSLLATLDQLANATAVAEAQDDSQSNYAAKIEKPELQIDWQQSAVVIDRKIRAFNPFPVCYSLFNKERIKIWLAEPISLSTEQQLSYRPGEIMRVDKKSLQIACGEGALAITQLQLPGARAMDVAALMNSKAEYFSLGACFE